jgi:hypothetical protein
MLYCIIRTAKEGHHSSCSVERAAANCAGLEKVYNYEGPSIPAEIASDPRAKSLADRIAHDQQAFAKPKEGAAPKTLFELGGRAVSASRQGWRNARDRIGGGSENAAATPPTPEAQPPLPLNAAATHPSATTASAAPSQPAVKSSATPMPKTSEAPVTAPAPSTGNRAQRASAAVGGFARKSLRCMRSLFRNCSDEADSQTLQ